MLHFPRGAVIFFSFFLLSVRTIHNVICYAFSSASSFRCRLSHSLAIDSSLHATANINISSQDARHHFVKDANGNEYLYSILYNITRIKGKNDQYQIHTANLTMECCHFVYCTSAILMDFRINCRHG